MTSSSCAVPRVGSMSAGCCSRRGRRHRRQNGAPTAASNCWTDGAHFMAIDLFISYSRSDWERVQPWVERLQGAGVTVWIDRSGIDGALLWTQEIAAAIEGCRSVALMASAHSVASEHVVRELTLAVEARKP